MVVVRPFPGVLSLFIFVATLLPAASSAYSCRSEPQFEVLLHDRASVPRNADLFLRVNRWVLRGERFRVALQAADSDAVVWAVARVLPSMEFRGIARARLPRLEPDTEYTLSLELPSARGRPPFVIDDIGSFRTDSRIERGPIDAVVPESSWDWGLLGLGWSGFELWVDLGAERAALPVAAVWLERPGLGARPDMWVEADRWLRLGNGGCGVGLDDDFVSLSPPPSMIWVATVSPAGRVGQPVEVPLPRKPESQGALLLEQHREMEALWETLVAEEGWLKSWMVPPEQVSVLEEDLDGDGMVDRRESWSRTTCVRRGPDGAVACVKIDEPGYLGRRRYRVDPPSSDPATRALLMPSEVALRDATAPEQAWLEQRVGANPVEGTHPATLRWWPGLPPTPVAVRLEEDDGTTAIVVPSGDRLELVAESERLGVLRAGAALVVYDKARDRHAWVLDLSDGTVDTFPFNRADERFVSVTLKDTELVVVVDRNEPARPTTQVVLELGPALEGG